MEERLRWENERARQAGARHDLTIDQWLETLEYFDYKCAYCGGEYQVIEHYLPAYIAGTTVGNCLPACLPCNVMKDKYGHDLSFYQNEKVVRFIESKGLKISFHIHEYKALRKDYVVLFCEGCGQSLDAPGLSFDEAKDYIDQYLKNTGYAYIA